MWKTSNRFIHTKIRSLRRISLAGRNGVDQKTHHPEGPNDTNQEKAANNQVRQPFLPRFGACDPESGNEGFGEIGEKFH